VCLCAVFVSAPVVAGASSPSRTPEKTKVSCKKVGAALTDLSYQYQKLLFLDSAEAWATTARDTLGGTLDGAKLRADAKALVALKSVKTTSLGFPTVKSVLANLRTLADLVDQALASDAPFPGPGQDAYENATERGVGDRAALSYANEQVGCRGNTG
jgi:hypothetical protein